MGRPRVPLEIRFWKRVIGTADPDACWGWLGGADKDGYGRLWLGGAEGPNIVASRFSWQIHFGPIPDGLRVLHRCDNPPCCNPHHLFLGTNAENSADMVTKGRSFRPVGALAGAAKMTEADVAAIRERAGKGQTQRAIAAQFGLSFQQISRIVRRDRWAHIP